MLNYIFMASVSVAVLGVLVFVHELGHFLIAKWCKVGVVEFALGFGPKVISRRLGETMYSIRAIPLGGYVRMIGDDPFEVEAESTGSALKAKDVAAGTPKAEKPSALDDPEFALQAVSVAADDPVFVAMKRDKSRWFLNQNLPKKAAIVLAGPAFNLFFAIFASIGLFAVYGDLEDVNDPIIGEVIPDLPAAKAGIQKNDRIVSIDGQEMASWKQLSDTIRASKGKELKVSIERVVDGKSTIVQAEVTGTAEKSELNILDGTIQNAPADVPFRIGISQSVRSVPVGFGTATLLGVQKVWGLCTLTGRILHAMVTGLVSPTKVLGGPVAVFAGAAQSAQRGFESTLNFMVLLSVSLAIFNLFPIPVLDGGHLLFFLLEAIKGKPLSIRFQAVANQVGMALLLLLMLFAVSNDVFRLL